MKAKTLQELLYSAVFPEDPIADWSKSQLSSITEKHRKIIAFYDEALRMHRHEYSQPYWAGSEGSGGAGSGGSGGAGYGSANISVIYASKG